MNSNLKIKDNNKLPIFYSINYDIRVYLLDKLHLFDSCKWSRIVDFLIKKSSNVINLCRIHSPPEATNEELLVGHTPEYLESLESSKTVANILELSFIRAIPNYFVQRNVLSKFRHQVKGTIEAAKMALERKWAINIGGGFHHASKSRGGGFCVYADISIAIKTLKKEHPDYKFLIIDLDAHQGNGHEIDFPPGNNVYIMDIFNLAIYPHDEEAKRNITFAVPIISWTNDANYMEKLNETLEKAFNESKPHLVLYNAGTDCLVGDPLGRLDLTAQGIKHRDEAVFQMAKDKEVPIVMVTSGGYQMMNAEIIADSIMNLFDKGIID